MVNPSQARRRRARVARGSDDEADAAAGSSGSAPPPPQSQSPQSDVPTTTDSPRSSTSSDDMPEQIVLKRHLSAQSSRAEGSGNSSNKKRKHNQYTYSVDAPGTKLDAVPVTEVPWFRRVAASTSTSSASRPPGHRRILFTLGTVLGAALMFFLVGSRGLDAQMQTALAIVQDQFGIDLTNLSFPLLSQNDLTDVSDRLFSAPREWLRNNDFSTGRKMAADGYRADLPVVLVPGIISTGLESWSTGENEQGNFRKRLWGTGTMMRTIVFDKDGWINQIKLDEQTGLDPPGIKVRAAQGLDAADYFITGYWIWSKILENLAAIGYDTNNLFLAGYDWRLSMINLEERDQYFSRLKHRIEANKKILGKKTVLVSHSMGSTVMLFFLKWVEAEGPTFGNGGSSWVEDHIDTFVSIAGTWLGVPKAMAALFTGEMRDTVELPPPAAYLLEKFFSREERARLFRGWSGSSSMLLKGGEAVWGGHDGAPDDPQPSLTIPNSTALGGGEWRADNVSQSPTPSRETFGMLYNFRASPPLSAEDQDALGPYAVEKNISAQDSLAFLLSHAPGWYQQAVYYNYSNGIEYDEDRIAWNGKNDPRTWTNPLEVALPYAPSMKLVNLYGEGKPTERAYWIEHGPFEPRGEVENSVDLEGQCDTCFPVSGISHFNGSSPPSTNDSTYEPGDSRLEPFPTARPAWIDSTVHTLGTGEGLGTRAGCRLGEGDGTVSLLSLGAMAAEGWQRKRYNPAGIKIITHEVKHNPDVHDLRGGTTTGDHVDILGSWPVNENVLKAAAGRVDDIEEHTASKIRQYAQKIHWDAPPPGLSLRKENESTPLA